MLTDTHCHMDSDKFNADRPAVIRRALDAGVGRMLSPGVNVESSKDCVQIASENSAVYAAVGVHPEDAENLGPDSLQGIRALAAHPRVVAIGEIGLDYYWVHDQTQQARQRDLLREQLRMASELRKPVILHCRERGDADHGPCSDDLLDILSEGLQGSPPALVHPGVLHSFSSNLAAAQSAIELGFLIGVTGPVTYKNAAAKRELIAALPLDCLLIETDSPYLAPEPHRGRRNEPAFVTHIADKIAAIQTRSPEEIAAVTAQNAARLFGWGETA